VRTVRAARTGPRDRKRPRSRTSRRVRNRANGSCRHARPSSRPGAARGRRNENAWVRSFFRCFKIYRRVSGMQGVAALLANDYLSSTMAADLFPDTVPDAPTPPAAREDAPLADRLRPQSLDEVIGQEHLTGPEGAIGRMVAAG